MTLIADLLSDIDDFGFTDTDTRTKMSAIEGAIRQIEEAQPWPFLELSIDLTFDGTSGTPTNFPLATFRATQRVKDVGTGTRLQYVRLDDFEDYVGTDWDEVGTPILYYFEANQLKVWRVPASTTTIRMKYIGTSTATITEDTVDADILIPARYKKAILYGALVDLNDLDDDPDIAARNEQKRDQAIERMIEDAFRKQYDRPEIIHAVDPDDWDYGTFNF